ncbi:MAG: tetratricopeptide repeat protein [Cyanobacteria bacterium HKST-UBA02]|nr:tetratricopeptide repeat protein [Cyanobacteria bacterium HKST-UBA02]
MITRPLFLALLLFSFLIVSGDAAHAGNGLQAPLKAQLDTLETPQQKALKALKEGAALHSAGDLEGAEKRFRQAASLDPDNPDSFFNLGAMAEGRGDLDGALTLYQNGLRLSPRDNSLKQAVDSINGRLAARLTEDDLEQADGLVPIVMSSKPAEQNVPVPEQNIPELDIPVPTLEPTVVPVPIQGVQPAPQVSIKKQLARQAARRAAGMVVRQGLNMGLRAALGGSICGGGMFRFGF